MNEFLPQERFVVPFLKPLLTVPSFVECCAINSLNFNPPHANAPPISVAIGLMM